MARAEVAIEALQRRWARQVDAATDGLLDLLQVWAADGDPWAPQLGSLEAAVHTDDAAAVVKAAVRLGLWAHESFVPGCWEASLAEPTMLRLAPTVLAPAQHVEVEGDVEGYRVRWSAPDGSWTTTTVDRNVAVDGRCLYPCVGSARVWVVLREGLRAWDGVDFFAADGWNVPAQDRGFSARLAEVGRLIAASAPDYLPWLERLLRVVVPTEAAEGQMESGSTRSLPGLVHIACLSYLPALAEMLVHELSHQHYYAATCLGPVDDGSDATLYYSPIKGSRRPIANILLAYHAFGNVAFLMDDFIAAGLPDPEGWLAGNRQSVLEQIGPLDAALQTTRALSDVGHALYEPLARALARPSMNASAEVEVRSLIVKVAERCNLNCSYCYMYQHQDQSFLSRPRFMSDEIFDSVLRRAREECARPHRQMSLVFHGGEPTLIGPSRFERLAGKAREVLGEHLAYIAVQTNGTLLDKRWASVLRALDVQVGVSLDGPPEINDRSRVDHFGRGSWARVVRGIDALRAEGIEPAVLTVVTPGESGLPIFEHFLSEGLRHIDFLLPDVSHDSFLLWYGGRGETPVADYLLPVFDAWFELDDASVFVGLFWDLIERMLGGPGLSDVFGNPALRYVVIETDGSIEGLDALRVCDEGIASSGLNVLSHAFVELAHARPLVAKALSGQINLCATCQACEHEAICGGGYLPHRYSRRNGFDNPSVWCRDLKVLIAHIRDAVIRRDTA